MASKMVVVLMRWSKRVYRQLRAMSFRKLVKVEYIRWFLGY